MNTTHALVLDRKSEFACARGSHLGPFDWISMFTVAHNFSSRIPRAEIELTRTIESFDLAATSRGDNRNPWKLLLVFVVSTTTRGTRQRARRSFTIFQDENKRAPASRRVAARRTVRVAVRRDISALRARAQPCVIREPRTSGEAVDNKRSRRELQPVLVKITSPYDSRSSYGAHTRVIITGNDAAVHFDYSCFFWKVSAPFSLHSKVFVNSNTVVNGIRAFYQSTGLRNLWNYNITYIMKTTVQYYLYIIDNNILLKDKWSLNDERILED